MNTGRNFRGSLFAEDFLCESIQTLDEWNEMSDNQFDDLENSLRSIFDAFPTKQSPNESQTEDDLIWPVLHLLGWTARLRNQNLSVRGREDIPDGLLFSSSADKERANKCDKEWKRYELGLVVVESKRWLRPLDRRSGRRGEESAPSTQMLRYLRRVDDLTSGKLRWGILTNGTQWRLYYGGARSVSEQFFEVNLNQIFDDSEIADALVKTPIIDRRHWLKVFVLMFRRNAFLPSSTNDLTFHQHAIAEGRYYQEKVTANLSALVFEHVFPSLARALALAEPSANLNEVKDAALVLLYRLLFILYAEDRDLLPVHEERFDDYALRERVRGEIGRRKEKHDVFSDTAARYWSVFDDLCRVINQGDASTGIPPYNGGLFDPERTPMLSRVRLNDQTMADVIDALSFEETPEGRRYINYRDLGVQQLGSIYERLLEQEVCFEEEKVVIRPNIFARKDSGSFYTPENLVGLIVKETLDPLVQERLAKFKQELSSPAFENTPEHQRLGRLKMLDPAEKLLELQICDPAMGSGHFLVNLVDYLSDLVIEAMAEAEASVEGYISPLVERIDTIRNTIMANAEKNSWTVDVEQLDDRHIVRRMVLKRCVYGVDKNPMAVELSKVSLWLHTFTVGAPLSFLDHHLRCGDSLFGAWVRPTLDTAEHKNSLFLRKPLNRATRAAAPMQVIERLTDAEIAEAHRSADIFTEISEMTGPLDAFMRLLHAFEWLNVKEPEDRRAYLSWLEGRLGDSIALAQNVSDDDSTIPNSGRFTALLNDANALIQTERFFNWQVAFPGIWSDWEENDLHGGFDAMIGNPPWDRMKLQQVEWFTARRPEIARASRAADRKRMIAELKDVNDPLAVDYEIASSRAKARARVARNSGDYPLVASGDLNLYSMFVERAMKLLKPGGMIGLLVPSGIASDLSAAKFFNSLVSEGRLKAFFDFENKKTFFPDVDARFKFCVLVASSSPIGDLANFAFHVHSLDELADPERCFPLAAKSFSKVNPNTRTAPVFRTRRDANLTSAIYDRLPVLVDHSSDTVLKTWPVKYHGMFHMTNDSHLFRTREELEEQERAWPVGQNRFDSPSGEWLPLYEGKMVQAFDHRAASIKINANNVHRPAQPKPALSQQHADLNWSPDPQFWVPANKTSIPEATFQLGFKHVTSVTNVRSMIAVLIPRAGAGNSLPLLIDEDTGPLPAMLATIMVANLNALPLDYVLRQKVQGQNLNWYIIEQLPVVPLKIYKETMFESKTALEIVREIVLELTYTAFDIQSFARELDYLDDSGHVLPPFNWDLERRSLLRAKLDALYFYLYGVIDRDDIRYIYSTFPIVEQEDRKLWGNYRSRDLCLAYNNSFAAGKPDIEIEL